MREYLDRRRQMVLDESNAVRQNLYRCYGDLNAMNWHRGAHLKLGREPKAAAVSSNLFPNSATSRYTHYWSCMPKLS